MKEVRCLKCGGEAYSVSGVTIGTYHACLSGVCRWMMSQEEYESTVCEALEEALEES